MRLMAGLGETEHFIVTPVTPCCESGINHKGHGADRVVRNQS